MFFQKISGLLAVCTAINITMVKSGDEITLSVIPKLKEGEKQDLPPIIMTGKAEELDKGFAEAWGQVDNSIGILSNINLFTKAAQEKADVAAGLKEDKNKADVKPSTTGAGKKATTGKGPTKPGAGKGAKNTKPDSEKAADLFEAASDLQSGSDEEEEEHDQLEEDVARGQEEEEEAPFQDEQPAAENIPATKPEPPATPPAAANKAIEDDEIF